MSVTVDSQAALFFSNFRAGLYNNALVVANMALEISPKFVVIHFTMANIYAAKVSEKICIFHLFLLADVVENIKSMRMLVVQHWWI